MWVFDGEEWFQDDGGVEPSITPAPAPTDPRCSELVPELQVVEIVSVPTRKRNVPPLPMP